MCEFEVIVKFCSTNKTCYYSFGNSLVMNLNVFVLNQPSMAAAALSAPLLLTACIRLTGMLVLASFQHCFILWQCFYEGKLGCTTGTRWRCRSRTVSPLSLALRASSWQPLSEVAAESSNWIKTLKALKAPGEQTPAQRCTQGMKLCESQTPNQLRAGSKYLCSFQLNIFQKKIWVFN